MHYALPCQYIYVYLIIGDITSITVNFTTMSKEEKIEFAIQCMENFKNSAQLLNNAWNECASSFIEKYPFQEDFQEVADRIDQWLVQSKIDNVSVKLFSVNCSEPCTKTEIIAGNTSWMSDEEAKEFIEEMNVLDKLNVGDSYETGGASCSSIIRVK